MKLKELRLKSGIKAQKIADELGISRVQLYNLEKGIYKLDKLKEEKLSLMYKVPLKTIKNAQKERKKNE